jgi:hypothetical protein
MALPRGPFIRKFNRGLAWVVPLSTQIKDNPYYYTIYHEEHPFSVLLSQLRLVSTKRFLRYIRKLSPGQFRKIQSKIVGVLYNERIPLAGNSRQA